MGHAVKCFEVLSSKDMELEKMAKDSKQHSFRKESLINPTSSDRLSICLGSMIGFVYISSGCLIPFFI